jgi:hypothetical protein
MASCMIRSTYKRQVEPPAPLNILLGRDGLNQHRVLLDGLGLALEIG